MVFTRVIAICFAVSIPLTISCASSDENEGFAPTKKDAGKDTGSGTGGSGTGGSGTGGSGTGGSGTGGSGTGGAGTGGSGTGGANTGGSGGGGTCNVDFCPTPAPPASKCCVTANGPCGVDYGQGQGCQSASNTGGSGP